jgi:uncharacterized SAM-dependent methyltransferase
MGDKKTIVTLEFDANLFEKINALKKYYAVQSNAKLLRVLINERAQQLSVGTVGVITTDN